MTLINTTAILLATLIHDAGRQPVAAGQTLAHAVDPAKTRPFIEFSALPEHVRQGRLLTATRLLQTVEIAGLAVEDPEPHAPETVDWLAAEIHNAERAAVDAGLVLVKLNRPWVAFADLPEQAQEGRRGQARYLLGRLYLRRPRASQEHTGATWTIRLSTVLGTALPDPGSEPPGTALLVKATRTVLDLLVVDATLTRNALVFRTRNQPLAVHLAALEELAAEFEGAYLGGGHDPGGRVTITPPRKPDELETIAALLKDRIDRLNARDCDAPPLTLADAVRGLLADFALASGELDGANEEIAQLKARLTAAQPS